MKKIGDKVWLSTMFLRSIGGTIRHAEHKGEIKEIIDDWFAMVEWQDGEKSSINVHNLVLDEDKAKEARDVEHKNLAPSIQIGIKIISRWSK